MVDSLQGINNENANHTNHTTIPYSCKRKKFASGPNQTDPPGCFRHRLTQEKPLRRGIGPNRQALQFSCTPMQVPPSYPRSLLKSAFQPHQTLCPPQCLHHNALSSQHRWSLQHDSRAQGIMMLYEVSVGQGTDTRRQEDYGHTYTHDPPILEA